MADASKPILPGADVTSRDLPYGPKPLEALNGDAGSKVKAIMVTKLLPDVLKSLRALSDMKHLTIGAAPCVFLAW